MKVSHVDTIPCPGSFCALQPPMAVNEVLIDAGSKFSLCKTIAEIKFTAHYFTQHIMFKWR